MCLVTCCPLLHLYSVMVHRQSDRWKKTCMSRPRWLCDKNCNYEAPPSVHVLVSFRLLLVQWRGGHDSMKNLGLTAGSLAPSFSSSLQRLLSCDWSHGRESRWRGRCFPLSTMWGAWWERGLPAGTGIHRHVGIDFEHHFLVLVKEQDAEGRHLLRDTARLWNARNDTHRPHDALDGRVVGGLQGLRRRNRADDSQRHNQSCPKGVSSPDILGHIF